MPAKAPSLQVSGAAYPTGIGVSRGAASYELNPLSIEGLNGWWRASDLADLPDGSSIAQWNDRVGGTPFLQATASKRPALVKGIFAGKGGVRFNSAASQEMTTASRPNLTALTLIAVFTRTTDVAERGVVALSGATNARHQLLASSDVADSVRALVGTGAGSYSEIWSTPGPGPVVVSSLVNSTSDLSELWGNGVLVDSASGLPDVTTGSLWYIGSRFTTAYFNADLAEVLVYNRALTTGERNAIEKMLGARYRIAVT